MKIETPVGQKLHPPVATAFGLQLWRKWLEELCNHGKFLFPHLFYKLLCMNNLLQTVDVAISFGFWSAFGSVSRGSHSRRIGLILIRVCTSSQHQTCSCTSLSSLLSLFKILNVNNSAEKSIFYCKNQKFLEEFLKRAPELELPYVPTRFWGFSGHIQTIIQVRRLPKYFCYGSTRVEIS